jgi:cytidine deaminase
MRHQAQRLVRTMDTDTRRDLLDHARQATEHAYVPYSHFPVGAALLLADGSIVTGANIENASYPLTICAERSAVATAASAGHREIRAVAVSAPRSSGTSPCGACRQVLNEFRPVDGDMVVILDDGEDGIVTSIDELLPRAFGPRNLAE